MSEIAGNTHPFFKMSHEGDLPLCKKSGLLLFILLFFSLQGFASSIPLNCDSFQEWQKQECEQILNDGSLSLEEEKDLFLNLRFSQEELPLYDEIWNYNSGLNFYASPNNVEVKETRVFKDAWLKIASIDKSFFDLNNQKWFLQKQGRVLTAYNFRVEVPSEIMPGDCRFLKPTRPSE